MKRSNCCPSVERCLHCSLPVEQCTGGKYTKRGLPLDRSESFAMRCGDVPKIKVSKKASIPYLTGSVGDCGRVRSNMHSVCMVTWCSALL